MTEGVGSSTRASTSVDFVEEFAAAAERFAVAVAWTDLRANVPSCPRWTALDLVLHLGNVHAWAATIVETGERAVEQNDEPRSTRPRAVSQWYAGKAEDLYEVLRHTSLGKPCWNFAFGTGVVGFWPRRQLHETTVHQIDLDLVSGRETTVEPHLAVDGIDEVLTVMAHRMHSRGHPAALERPLAITASDTGDTWVLTPASTSPGPGAPVPAQSVGTNAETVAGPPPTVGRGRSAAVGVEDRIEAPADVLYRTLWKRLAVDRAHLRLDGDPDRVHAFLASRLVP